MGASLSELEQPPQSQPQQTHQHSQLQPQQHQHQQNEPTNKEELRSPSRRENLLSSPQHQTKLPSSKKAVQNSTVVKSNETQSATKPLIKELSLPHNYEHILKDADSSVDKSSREKMCDQLYAGVFLHHKTKVSSISFSFK
jgi:hypothetical protein